MGNGVQHMNNDSDHSVAVEDAGDTRPILIIPYMWIGDFVRGHSVVRVLNQRFPNRPVDLLTTSLVRAAGRLYARRPGRHRLGPAARPAGGRQAVQPRRES